ncbi:MAG: M14 family metallopeptidase [Actinomycetota bacterium]
MPIDQRRLDTDYATARTRFLDAATRAGAQVTSSSHPDRGRDGEELAVDVATLGAADADAVLLVVSGTHGVEGFAGSAIQSWWLDERAADLSETFSDQLRVVLVHGLNPVGFSWVRRVNEDNVDLNRNFIDWSTQAPRNEGYDALAADLVPSAWDDETIGTTTTALLERAAEIGMDWLQQAVSGGQYDHPTGVFYGGTKPVWSHEWLVRRLPEMAASCDRLVVLDLHTGLGPWGHAELISSDPADTAAYRRGTAWWGEVNSMVDGDSVSAELSGDWLRTVPSLVPDAEVTAVAVEYGTVDMVSVLQSLRADAWLHGHGDPSGPAAEAIRAQVRAAFLDDDPAWVATIIERFDDICGVAVAQLTA